MIIGVMPDGRSVLFDSITTASYRMKTSSGAIGKAVRGNHICGNWMWYRAIGNEKVVPFEEEMLDSFVLRKVKKNSTRKASDVDEENETPLEAGLGQKILNGYIMLGMSPTICPICGKVMGCGPNATKHVFRCIGDRPYRIKLGVIKVLVDE